MSAKFLKALLSLHSKLGVVLGLFVLMWTLTGVLHPIMSAYQPQPQQRMAPPQQLDLAHAQALPDILKQQHIVQVAEAQAIQITPTVTAYRIRMPEAAEGLYFNSQTGALMAHGEQQDAERLALWYTGKTVDTIKDSHLVTSFGDDYPYVNRLLPAWCVEFKDGLRAYVDPSQSRLATLSDDRKMWMARIFRLGHTWMWGQHEWLGQQTIMKMVLIALLLLTLAGLFIFVKIHNRKNHRLRGHPARTFHRYLGLSLSVFVLLWVFSGFYHIWHESRIITKPVAMFATNQLTTTAWRAAVAHPIQRLSLVPIERDYAQASAGWLMQPPSEHGMHGSMTGMKEHQHHAGHMHMHAPTLHLINAQTGEEISPLVQAKQLAAFYTGLPVSQIGEPEWITQFSGEYGFVNKRLPVLKVPTQREDGLRLYIEPANGVLASQVTNADASEGWSFAYLHKWSWFTGEKWLKDTLMAVTAGLIALLVLLGFRVWWLKRHKSL